MAGEGESGYRLSVSGFWKGARAFEARFEKRAFGIADDRPRFSARRAGEAEPAGGQGGHPRGQRANASTWAKGNLPASAAGHPS